MKDVFEIIRDVRYCGREQPVGLETACDIVEALNREGYIIAPAASVLTPPAPERKLCDGCDGHECDDDCQYPMVDPFQAQRS